MATRFIVGRGDHLRQAKALAMTHSVTELSLPTAHSKDNTRWELWVSAFIEAKYSAARTRKHVKGHWKRWYEFLKKNDLPNPAAVRREHAFSYLEWRTTKNGKALMKPCRNTIRNEIFSMSSILNEAFKRGWIAVQPFLRLRISQDMHAEKKEMTDAHAAKIRAYIEDRLAHASNDVDRNIAHYLRVSFEIAWHQGCRMSETYIDMANVDLERMELHLVGKGSKPFVQPINPELMPLLRELASQGRTRTYELPKNHRITWWYVFRQLRAKHPEFVGVSFHSTRVRIVSRMARAGVPESMAMKLVNHSSATVHRIYNRVRPSDLAPYWDRINAVT